MKELIRQRALELGFDACQFTSAQPPDHAPEFQRWLGERRHGEMNYMERNAAKRIAPELVLAGAKSVIALAVSYARAGEGISGNLPPLTPAQRELSFAEAFALSPLRGEGEATAARGISSGRPTGVVARYARFDDYHLVIGQKLKALDEFIRERGSDETRSLWYIDTGPLIERDFAQRAGLGFVGKHTNLISRTLGNWIFLAEIITTLELEPDAPEKNRCGSCTRCLEACPTAAITGPFQLDARRCISYLTIELKGSIPVEFRRAIGNRIYGCDDCLAACPWNRFAREGRMMKARARSDLAQPDLLALLALDETGFKRRFAGTPMLRTRRRGLLRNVCVALGNVGDPSALPELRRAATENEPLIAEHAQWAIGEIESRHVA